MHASLFLTRNLRDFLSEPVYEGPHSQGILYTHELSIKGNVSLGSGKLTLLTNLKPAVQSKWDNIQEIL